MRTFDIKCPKCGKVQPYQTKSHFLYNRGKGKYKKCYQCEKTFLIHSPRRSMIVKERI